MAKQPFPNCPLGPEIKQGARTCIWDKVETVDKSADGKEELTLYQCRLCGDRRVKRE